MVILKKPDGAHFLDEIIPADNAVRRHVSTNNRSHRIASHYIHLF